MSADTPASTSPDLIAEYAPLTRAQKVALGFLVEHERRLGHPLEPGDAGVYTRAWYDSYTTGLHWRTAQALARRGLISVDWSGAYYEDPPDVFLTDAGRARIDGSQRAD